MKTAYSAETKTIHCPVETIIGLIGGKYKTLILWKLINQTQRFSELQKAIPQATAKMLTQQLRELEADGLLHREVYPVIPPKVEYSLTPLGKSIQPILESMYNWGDHYLQDKGIKANCCMTTTKSK